MNNQPLVSAIMIFLNEERFIDEAIESVFAQTYDHWELLLVDDGSTNNSSQIALDYARRYPDKIQYLEHPNHENRGMSASRNLGIQNAKGKYISYIDSDDVWLPNKLERQVELLEPQTEAVMVYAPLMCWYSWTGLPEDQDKDHLYGVQLNGRPPFNNSVVEPPKLIPLFLKDKNLTPSGVLVKRETLLTIAPSENSFRTNYSDDVVQIKICLHCKVLVSDEPLYKYRIHPESNCRKESKAGKSYYFREVFLNWVEQYFREHHVTNPLLIKALKQAYLPYKRPYLYRIHKSCQVTGNLLQNLVIKWSRNILPKNVRDWLWSRWVKLKTLN